MAYGYITQTAENETWARQTIIKTLNGIEGIPYQFLPSVDRRVLSNGQPLEIGRKYAEKIVSRIPLLFLTPCEPVFMEGFDKNDSHLAVEALLSQNGNFLDFEKMNGRYYSVEFAYARYYDYLNLMLSSVAYYLGIADQYVLVNGSKQQIKYVDWSKEINEGFRTYFSSEENLVFYLDAMESVSESFGNSTTQSSLASMINGLSDQAKEIDFLFGKNGSNTISAAIGAAGDATSSILSSAANLLNVNDIGGSIVGSLANTGADIILDGGKIAFPDIWSDSSYEKAYSIDIKLRSPDNDSLSIFLNVLKPYCKILALTLPHVIQNNINAYRTPFLVKAYSKGLFNVDMGMIDGISVTKGAACCWNDDGLPTQIDISINIVDLYKSLAMSGYTDDSQNVGFFSTFRLLQQGDQLKSVVNNTAYMDFLANMAGLNINQMEIGRKVKMYLFLGGTRLSNIPSTLDTRFDQSVTKIIGKAYKFFNGN